MLFGMSRHPAGSSARRNCVGDRASPFAFSRLATTSLLKFQGAPRGTGDGLPGDVVESGAYAAGNYHRRVFPGKPAHMGGDEKLLVGQGEHDADSHSEVVKLAGYPAAVVIRDVGAEDLVADGENGGLLFFRRLRARRSHHLSIVFCHGKAYRGRVSAKFWSVNVCAPTCARRRGGVP